jgi:alpha-L-fucosidase
MNDDPLLATAGDSAWFQHARFGMFIHWGLYAMAARHEWIRHNDKITTAAYQEYFDRFDPDLYNPEAWAEAAADAGMGYVVVTAKHHEGFCLWDSAHTAYKATNTPAKRDLLRPLTDAMRAKGLRAGLYYSLLDWHHPDFVIDPHIGPYREDPKRVEMNAGRDQRRYAAYMRDQVEELLTKYGDIDLLWFDFSYPKADGSGKGRNDWESEALLKLVRKLRPGILLDDRLDLPADFPGAWDFKTPERFQPRDWVRHNGRRVVWESCQTLGNSWGYFRGESEWRSVDQLVRMLIDTVAKGGNLLLNVGPTARGEFDPRALSRLRGIGQWMRQHDRAIRGCTQAPKEFIAPPDCRYTWNPTTRRLYLHCCAYPFAQAVCLPNLGGKIAYAQFLHDGSEIRREGLEAWQHNTDAVAESEAYIRLPTERPEVVVPVVEIFLK